VVFNRADHFGRRLYLSGRHRARACRFPGPAIGTDFSNVYAAGTYVRDGNPDAPFDLARRHAREQQIFGASATPFYGWHNPPFAVLSVRRRGLGADALWACTRHLTGGHARALSADGQADSQTRPHIALSAPAGRRLGRGSIPAGSKLWRAALTRG